MLNAAAVQQIVTHAQDHNLDHLVGRIRSLDATLKSTAESKELEDIIVIILGGGGGGGHHPAGWTSQAEYAFALGLVEAATNHAEQLAGMKQALLQFGRLVTSDSHAAAH